jgi:hypothetical protein
MLNSIVKQDDLSPTDFSMSVHNTSLGLFSIETNNKLPSTVISAGEDSFCYGLLESCIFLSKHPNTPVLFIYTDEAAPSVFSHFIKQDCKTLSIALLLTSQGQDLIHYKYAHQEHTKRRLIESQAESFLRFYLSGAQLLELQGKNKVWSWKRNS